MGILLVMVGVVLLLQTAEILPQHFWSELFRYWPVLFIVVGLDLLLGRRRPYFSAALVTLALIAAVTAAALTMDGPGQQPPDDNGLFAGVLGQGLGWRCV